jgi:hypothetical protein
VVLGWSVVVSDLIEIDMFKNVLPHIFPFGERFNPCRISSTIFGFRKSSGTPYEAQTLDHSSQLLINAGGGSSSRLIRRV